MRKVFTEVNRFTHFPVLFSARRVAPCWPLENSCWLCTELNDWLLLVLFFLYNQFAMCSPIYSDIFTFHGNKWKRGIELFYRWAAASMVRRYQYRNEWWCKDNCIEMKYTVHALKLKEMVLLMHKLSVDIAVDSSPTTEEAEDNLGLERKQTRMSLKLIQRLLHNQCFFFSPSNNTQVILGTVSTWLHI